MGGLLQLDAELERLPAGPLLVGFSGGLDSSVLLHALAHSPVARARGLRAIHVDHGLHRDSAHWATHCQAVCTQLGVPLQVVRVEVVPRGEGPEGAARNARWQAFRVHAGAAHILVLAHHRDDQAETVLLRLLRGAGPTGLSAMRPWCVREDGLRVWRPLLALPRECLRDYARQHALDWLDDPGNELPDYDRNLLRLEVMPRLRRRWPQLDATLAQVAGRMADAVELEHEAARRLLARAATPCANILLLPPLQAATRAQRWAALRLWLRTHGVSDAGAARLSRIERELIDAGIDADPCLPLGGRVLRRHRQTLHLLAAGADQPLRYRLEWDGLAPLTLPDGSVLALDPPPPQALALLVASRQGGERLRVHSPGPRRELRLLFQELGVPTWLRQRWPVLWQDGEPVAFADLVVAARFRRRLQALGCSLRFTPVDAPR